MILQDSLTARLARGVAPLALLSAAACDLELPDFAILNDSDAEKNVATVRGPDIMEPDENAVLMLRAVVDRRRAELDEDPRTWGRMIIFDPTDYATGVKDPHALAGDLQAQFTRPPWINTKKEREKYNKAVAEVVGRTQRELHNSEKAMLKEGFDAELAATRAVESQLFWGRALYSDWDPASATYAGAAFPQTLVYYGDLERRRRGYPLTETFYAALNRADLGHVVNHTVGHIAHRKEREPVDTRPMYDLYRDLTADTFDGIENILDADTMPGVPDFEGVDVAWALETKAAYSSASVALGGNAYSNTAMAVYLLRRDFLDDPEGLRARLADGGPLERAALAAEFARTALEFFYPETRDVKVNMQRDAQYALIAAWTRATFYAGTPPQDLAPLLTTPENAAHLLLLEYGLRVAVADGGPTPVTGPVCRLWGRFPEVFDEAWENLRAWPAPVVDHPPRKDGMGRKLENCFY